MRRASDTRARGTMRVRARHNRGHQPRRASRVRSLRRMASAIASRARYPCGRAALLGAFRPCVREDARKRRCRRCRDREARASREEIVERDSLRARRREYLPVAHELEIGVGRADKAFGDREHGAGCATNPCVVASAATWRARARSPSGRAWRRASRRIGFATRDRWPSQQSPSHGRSHESRHRDHRGRAPHAPACRCPTCGVGVRARVRGVVERDRRDATPRNRRSRTRRARGS